MSQNQLQWQEPRAYRRAVFREHEQTNRWEAPRFAAVAFVILIALRFFAGLNNPHAPGWPLTIAIAAALALFLAFVFPWLISYIAISTVYISPKGVNHNIVSHGATLRFWPWDHIAACSLTEVPIGDRAYRTLTLMDADEEPLASFALADGISVEDLRQVLAQYGVPCRQTRG